jgi:hypothetical protein
MADPKNDIITTVEATESDVADLKKAHYSAGGNTRQAAPVAQQPRGLNPQLVNMLTLGKTYYNFQGLDRCIRILDPNTSSQRHCGAMMVRNSSTNQFMCSNCDRVRDPNANPKVINSAMIRLSGEELKELGMTSDPLAGTAPIVNPEKKAKKAKKEPVEGTRRTKVKAPNRINIEVSMADLKSDPNLINVLLNKALEAIFELPVSNFREAEEIRVVKERVESFLQADKGEQNG